MFQSSFIKVHWLEVVLTEIIVVVVVGKYFAVLEYVHIFFPCGQSKSQLAFTHLFDQGATLLKLLRYKDRTSESELWIFESAVDGKSEG